MRYVILTLYFYACVFLSFGQEDKQHITYYDNGNVEEIGYFNQEGQLTETWIRYNEVGVKIGQVAWLNGIKHGTWLIWDNTGTLRFEMYYFEGKRNGTWKQFDETGNLITKKIY